MGWVCGALCVASHQGSLRLVRGVEGSDAIEALRKNLAPKCNVKRSGEWLDMESGNLVPGDVVKLNSMDWSPVRPNSHNRGSML